jgi:hypothetical protein
MCGGTSETKERAMKIDIGGRDVTDLPGLWSDKDKVERRIGRISNYYGGLWVKEESQKYWWGIENYDGTDWEEIPKSLFDELVKYDEARKETK